MDERFFLDNLWRRISGMPELEPPKPRLMPSLDALYASEWSPEFEMLMRNRLVMGAMRYGLLGDKNKPAYNRVDNAVARLKLYAETHNTEHLVDVANMCLIEFVEGDHPDKHFSSQDEHKLHAKAH
jgi:hypothetical protein